MEIISINESVSILINHIEGFFEFLKNGSNFSVGQPYPRPPDGPYSGGYVAGRRSYKRQ